MEIEFKAWDSKFNVMLPSVVVYDKDNIAVLDVIVNESYGDKLDERLEDIDSPGPEWYLITNDVTPLQYSGFKDRNGTKIHVGDIVREDFKTDGTYSTTGVVEFYEGSFGSRNEYGRFRIPALFTGPAIEGMNLNYYEIIGNVFESPELIPAKIEKITA
jgi:uncharacterized phage protein (TIGR01671 family)